jgi:hypothetical protein
MENSMEAPQKNTQTKNPKNRTAIDSAIPLIRVIPEGM